MAMWASSRRIEKLPLVAGVHPRAASAAPARAIWALQAPRRLENSVVTLGMDKTRGDERLNVAGEVAHKTLRTSTCGRTMRECPRFSREGEYGND